MSTGLGVELFRRTSRHVELTGAGRDLLPLAARLLAEAEHLLSSVREQPRSAGPRCRS